MNNIEQTKNAKEFVERWTGRGDEKQDAQSYWRDLLVNVLGVPSATLANFINFERKVQGGFIDAFIEDTGVLIEQKSLGVDLSKPQKQSDGSELTPYGQASRYAAKLPFSLRPRWIITSNFDTILVYDQENDPSGQEPYEIRLSDLPNELYRLSFITDKANSRLERERELSVKAGEVVGKLYASLSSQYQNIEDDTNEQRSLNILIVRLVFLLYAEDAGLLQHHGALYDYLKPIPVPQMRQAIIDLFRVLDTPDGSGGTENKRDPYLAPELLEFPYINGGLFSEENIIVPQFTDQIKLDLLVEASSKFDWSDVSPTIFGAVFESTLNPETRRAGGMHYTSIEDIHKVIDPLFLDDLRHELESIEALKTDRDRKIKLKAFQKKLGSIDILDPACGSGNFLTESYLSLRKLENRVIEGLVGEQMGLGFEGENNPIQVKLSQFYGIEINDFAVSVAKTALWIAESQMIEATQEIILQVLDFLPLKSNSNIVHKNALRYEWGDLLPAEKCNYIIGNPPFYGSSMCSPDQKQEIVDLYGRIKLSNSLDYVSGWYYKAAEMMQINPNIKAAFVSTNSICQGEQVFPIWNTLIERFGIHIDFAWTTFIWNSEATNKAHVHCVIVGFSRCGDGPRRLFHSKGDDQTICVNISPYLIDGPTVLVASSAKPISAGYPVMKNGSKPTDGGWYLFSSEEKDAFIEEEPESSRFFRPWVGSEEFINNKERWCLYLGNASPSDVANMPKVQERIEAVRKVRLGEGPNSKGKIASKRPPLPTQKAAETPMRFFHDNVQNDPYLIIPKVSSERRRYIPIGFVPSEVIASDLVSTAEHATLYDFGVLTSNAHNAWMRTVAGRLKSDYRYTPGLVYNTFVWPDPTPEQRQAIETAAQAVLDARAAHPGLSLAELYDPDKMPLDLLDAHTNLDHEVESAYGVDFNGDEEKMVAHLFTLYLEAVNH